MTRAGLGFDMQGDLALSRALAGYRRELPRLQERAIATLRRRLPVQARRDIQGEYNITATRVRKDLSARTLDDGLSLVGHFRGIGLRNFRARQTKKGVTSSIFRGAGRSLDPGAFLAPLLGGGVHAVERFGAKRVMTKGRYEGKRRQPIHVLYGPTLAQMLRKGRRPERLAEFSRSLLRSEVERQIQSMQRLRHGTRAP